jgi:hypothetical protein
MLYTSCKTSGLSHQLTRNLGRLIQAHQKYINWELIPQWKPKLAADNARYQEGFKDPNLVLYQKQQRKKVRAWDALEEVIRMAEGSSGLCFGRIQLRKTWYRTPGVTKKLI